MAKRGRKPGVNRKGYFYENEEDAIVAYINTQDIQEKNRIFNTVLYPALSKMIESIIRRYKLYVPDEEFEITFSDTISYLLTKIGNFKPVMIMYEELETINQTIKENAVEISIQDFMELNNNITEDSPIYIKICDNDGKCCYFEKMEKHYKAYSYCGTVCKNYLIYKNIQYTKTQSKTISYDTIADAFENNEKYSTIDVNNESLAIKLISKASEEIQNMVDNAMDFDLTDNECKVGYALINLLNNWEEVLNDGSCKMQKSSVLYFLREESRMSTKDVRANMKPFKKVYYELKKGLINQ